MKEKSLGNKVKEAVQFCQYSNPGLLEKRGSIFVLRVPWNNESQ